MSMEYADRKARSRLRSPWSSVAFIVESILLLLFLVASLAVLTKVFSASLTRGVESRTLDAATIAATSIAEHFAADPTSVQESAKLGDLLVRCDVTDDERRAGTLYHADIAVYDFSEAGNGEVVYKLSTSRYVSDETPRDSSQAAKAETSGSSGATSNASAAASENQASAADTADAGGASASAEASESEAAEGEAA